MDDQETKQADEAKVNATPVPKPEPEPSKQDRMDAWLAAYAHGLQHNSPRTQAELDELKSILGIGEPKAEQSGQ